MATCRSWAARTWTGSATGDMTERYPSKHHRQERLCPELAIATEQGLHVSQHIAKNSALLPTPLQSAKSGGMATRPRP